MKPQISNPFRSPACIITAFSVALFSHFAAPSAFAATYYWDNNTTTAGFGAASGTTWDTAGSTLWNNDSTGGNAGAPNILGTSIITATTDALNFGTSSAGLATGTITVSGTVDSGNMTFGSASGDITFNGGTINLAASTQIAVNGSTDTVTIASVISGAATALTKSGGGTLSIKGANGAISGGEIRITNGEVICANGATATGPNTLGGADGWTVQLGNTSGTTPATLSVGNSFSLPNPITVRTGSSGTKTLAATAGTINVTFSGIITANDDLTILQNVAGTTGNLTVNNSGNTVASLKTVTFSNNIGADLTDTSTWGGDGMLEYRGSGNGAITVSGAKTHSGGSTLGTRTGGSVVIGTSSVGPANAPTSGPFGTGTLTIGATRLLSTGGDRTIANAITFSGNPTFPTDASEKSFIFSGDASLGATRTLTVETGSTVAGKFVEFQGNISGAFGLTKAGAGVLTLSGANTYSGATSLSGGTLILNNANAFGTTPGVNGTSSISMAAGTTLRSNYIIADAGNVNSFVYAPITLTGTGSVNFQPGAGSSVAPAEAVTFNLNGAIGGTAGTDVVFSTPSTNTSNADSTIVLGAASTYNGNTTITAGNANDRLNVKAGVANALPSTTVLTFGNIAGGGSFRTTQFDLNGNNQTLAGLDNGGNVPLLRRQTVTNTGALATLTINNTANYTFGGANFNADNSATTRAQITGNLALVKSGAGTLTLDGTLANGATAAGNTYTGNTTVNEGILRIGFANPSNESSTVTIAESGATLDLAFTGTDTVDKLFFGTTQQPLGTYSSTSVPAGATITTASFLGTGSLTVNSGPSAGGFSAWQTANSTLGGLDEDHDGDGVTNGVEFFIYGPVANSGFTELPGVDNAAGTLSVTFTKAAGYDGDYGTDFVVETSATLANPWVAQIADPDPGFTVTFPSPTEVKYTFPAGTKNFARLKVTGP